MINILTLDERAKDSILLGPSNKVAEPMSPKGVIDFATADSMARNRTRDIPMAIWKHGRVLNYETVKFYSDDCISVQAAYERHTVETDTFS